MARKNSPNTPKCRNAEETPLRVLGARCNMATNIWAVGDLTGIRWRKGDSENDNTDALPVDRLLIRNKAKIKRTATLVTL